MDRPQRSIRQYKNFGNTYLSLFEAAKKDHQIEPILVSFSLLVGESGFARRLDNGFRPQRDPDSPVPPKRGAGKS